MFKNLTIQWRITILTSLLICVCCVTLSLVLNSSAFRMANSIEATTMEPAKYIEDINYNETSMPVEPALLSEQAKQSYFSESLAYTSIAVLLGGVLTYYLSGKMLKPIRELNEQTKNISAYNLDEIIEVPETNDEISELTVSFNELIAKLDKSFSTQKRFSANAAHELRTPLAVLQTKLDVFNKKEVHTDKEYQNLLTTFQNQIAKLNNTVNELLEIDNLEET